MPDDFFGGLDFGTSGARISIINLHKELVYSNSVPYQYSFKNPNSWINSCEELINRVPIKIRSNLKKLAISGTSGTLIATNLKGEPVGEAIPYGQACNEHKNLLKSLTAGEDHLRTPYSSLAKALKLIDKYGTNILLRHQSDWITGWFLKDWTHGEEGNNLKLGWDLIQESWPKSYLNTSWQKCLPQIIKSGEIIGQVHSYIAESFKLNKKLILISGTTDSNASLLAAGLGKEDGLTVLGTTIVVKKIINKPIKEKGITTHRVSGDWICGGASNAGCGILSKFYSDSEIKELSRQINTSKDTSLNLLPLNSKGERFPINNPYLEPVLGPRPVSDSLYLHALFEGLAKIELKGWEKLHALTGSLPKKIITVGGGSKNPQWRKIRKKIINIPIVSCTKTTSFGTALLAINAKQ
ncbi:MULTISPECIES: FGGY-family carbohydrate kinase [Prochlorococcus]|uniref:Carbohydrate kinase n=1 Tax=Prochlorococcus marinus str. MIT 9116 TaxID=167544 RepID=A0A0A1ZSP6_PROMR|nr:FGGY-family carbohydrate kinase [Prochlorococcus marinus]KGF90274.1 Carbohydrate kinase [Prochlorococcus marinus str. MIT 9107]KGF91299.1 Carbohydrate kinase [Prochlorococcus marinus str. MIT 9116]KGF94787.1 Carbohydrate kinase [Prochlorococcus marinus str. MIT 9123]